MFVPSRSEHLGIARLRIRGDRHDVESIAGQLQYESWSLNPPDEWIFVRSLSISGRKALRQQASNALDQACRQTVAGDSAAAPRANAVRFRNLPELLATLVRDILQGQPERCWYWAHWNHLLMPAPGDAISRLLWEYAECLPAIAEQLQQRRLLTKTWDSLSSGNARTVYQRVLTLGRSSGPGRPVPNADKAAMQGLISLLKSQPAVARHWAACLAHLDPADGRWHLAAATLGMQLAPSRLFRDPESMVQALQCVLRSAIAAKTGSAPEPASSEFACAINPATARLNRYNSEPDPQMPDTVSECLRRHWPDRDAATPEMPPNPDSHPIRLEQAAPFELQPQRSQVSPSPAGCGPADGSSANRTGGNLEPGNCAADLMTESPWTGSGQIATEFGGCFYLVNVVTRYLDVLQPDAETAPLGQGWRWLWSLIRQFDVILDAPLMQFLAEELALEDWQQLLQLSPGDNSVRLFRQLQRQHREIWNADLLLVPATINYTRSHLDCVFPLAAVNLPVRLAGLDIDPNWVPWLGRVVKFHYRQGPIPGKTI